MSQVEESVEDIANEVENRLPTITEENEAESQVFLSEENIFLKPGEPVSAVQQMEVEEEGESVENIQKEIIGSSEEKMETPTPSTEMKIVKVEHQDPIIVSTISISPEEALLPESTDDAVCMTIPSVLEEAKKEEINKEDSEHFDANPQVNIEDMKAAQDDLNRLDVLVCGGCHNVFHFVEDFTRHKPQCRRKSNFHGNIAETKPQVWAFLLWKNAQTKVTRRGIVEESSWKLYQKWCKMPERIRNAWIAAGETVMNFSNFALMKSEPKKKQERSEPPEIEVEEDRPVVMRKFVQRDHLGEIKEIRPSPGIMKRRLKEDIENIRNQLEDGDSSQDKENEDDMDGERLCTGKIQHIKTADGEELVLQEEEFVVEKIVSRRFNPRKKQYEYLIKWEGYPSEQNTWEPAENMEACQHLLKAFEENLTKQSMAKQTVGRGSGGGRKGDQVQAGPSGLNSYGRPVRYSKQKALNQVKAWCGSIKPDELELENSEDEEIVSKRIKMELESDSEDSLMGGRIMFTKGGAGGIVKRGGGGIIRKRGGMSNGTSGADTLAAALGLESSGDEGDAKAKLSTLALLNQKSIVNKVSTLSPANQQVLVANAKGVVKVDPSEVPNLTSGVYIMSNKSGIVKLDGVSPSKALSLKQGSVPSMPTSKGGGGGVVLVKNQGGSSGSSGVTVSAGSTGSSIPVAQKSGIMRKNPGILRSGTSMASPSVSTASSNILQPRGPGRPLTGRPSGVLRAESNTRILPRGSMNFTAGRPKAPLSRNVNTSQKGDSEKRILGPKPGRGGRGSGVFSRGRGGMSRSTASSDDMESVSSKGKDGKLMDNDSLLADFQRDTDTSESEVGLPDDFPMGDLPPLEPESPPRPLTLCPLTGKVLGKAEGEKTPEPTPPPSPKQPTSSSPKQENTVQIIQDESNKIEIDMGKLKNENPSSPTSAYLNRISSNKDVVVKKTLKPGSIGSVTVSPKKVLTEASLESKSSEDDMVTITGDDGLIYKVSNSLGNTLLVSGDDGQQCVYVTTGEDGDDNTAVLTLDPSYADLAQLSQVGLVTEGDSEAQFFVKEGEDGELVGLQVQEGGEEPQAQVVAQLVEAGEPAPGGGPRRVVLLLPDGNLMVTEVDEEQYAALELDK